MATAGAVAIAVLFASVLVYTAVRADLRGQVDRSLLQRALSHRDRNGGTTYSFDVPGIGGPGVIQFVTHKGEVITGPRDAITLPVTPAALEVARTGLGPDFTSTTVTGMHLRVVTVPFRRGIALQLARPLDEVDAILGRLGWVMLLVGVGGIALAASLGAAVARVALAPVDRLTRAAEEVAETRDPSRAIDSTGADELSRLASSFNTMLAALNDSLRAQRQLVADASHELRTPLTALRTNIEVLGRADDMAPGEKGRLLTDVVEQLDDLTALVGDLVDLARGDEPAQLEDEVALDDIVAREVERAVHNHKGIRFDITAEQTRIRGVPSRIGRAVSNLLDNAAKWSGPGAVVDVVVGAMAVTVRDRGPGIKEQDLPYVFDRFYRAPAARSLPGSGLGLSIVRQTMQTHGGTVSVENAPDGGAIFTLHFP